MPTTGPTDTTTPAALGVPLAVDPIHVVVVLPEHHHADHLTVRSELARHTQARYRPYPIYPIRSRGLRRMRPHQATALWDVVRCPDGSSVTAGGPRRRLDLQTLADVAGWQAHQRWQAWKTHVAAGTPRARDWESFLTPRPLDHPRAARALPLDEARARFEAQPRVLAMLAVNGQRILPFTLDPDELAAFQAGENVYCTLAAQQAVAGQMLVLPGGFAYRPVTASIADRLRYLRAALDVVHALPPEQHLAAMIRTPTR